MGLYGKKYKVDSVNVRAFLALTSSGLFVGEGFSSSVPGIDPSSIDWKAVDWDAVMQLAKEQALVGIVASAFDAGGSAGSFLGFELQEVLDRDHRKAFAKKVYSIEQRNQKMDESVAKLFNYLENNGLHPVLLKGQGIARSYANPHRRSPGDIDMLLQGEEYAQAKNLLKEKARKIMDEGLYEKQQQMFIADCIVELHGTMRVTLSKKIDSFLDGVMDRMFSSQDFSSFAFEGSNILTPSPQINAVYVFCHILEHLFHSGIGLRQVCDLCRILHVYRDEIDRGFLETELKRLGLMDEWNAFATLMVNYLGAPAEDIPFFPVHTSACNNSTKWNRKAKKILSYILSTGNMGKNRDLSYRKKSPYLIKKTVTLWFIISNAVRLGSIFPKDTAMISFKGLASGLKDLAEHK